MKVKTKIFIISLYILLSALFVFFFYINDLDIAKIIQVIGPVRVMYPL